MEFINEKIDNDISLKFKPIKKTVSLSYANGKSIERKGFDEWALTSPLRAVLDLESSCNLNCKYCSYANSKENNERIPKDKVFQIIDELEKMKVFEFSLRGGEPTIHPDFEEIWNYAQNKKFLTTNVITNGLVLNYKKAKKYLANPAARIIISLDGFPEINDCYRDPRQYKKVMSWLPAILKEFPYQVVILTCLYKDSVKKAMKFSEYLAELGLKFHDFSPLRREGYAFSYNDKEFLSLKQMKELQKKLNGIKKKFPDFRPLITCSKVHKDEYQDLQDFPVPLFNEIYQSTIIRIHANGNVLVSNRTHFDPMKENIKEKECLGNIFEKSLEEIWLSTKEVRKKQVAMFHKNESLFLSWKNNIANKFGL